MTKTIEQTVRLPAPAKVLYEMFIDPGRHAAFTGGPVRIGPKPGSRFSAFGGALSGSTVLTVPGKLIVQRWRSTNFAKTDPDSILVLAFSQEGDQGRIDMAHVNVPQRDYAGVTKGWKKHYWTPMREFLKNGKR